MEKDSHLIGWDVGGWNCDKNSKSRDAIVILSPNRGIVGKPWRGNLTPTINEAQDTADFVARLYSLCGVAPSSAPIIVSIDTPLGFSTEFVRLTSRRIPVRSLGRSAENPYLYRATERLLCELGKVPLSPVKDMIGSQATKGMHVLGRFAPRIVECGVWSDGAKVRAIEAYPGACKRSSCLQALRAEFERFENEDLDDALTCALIAYLFEVDRAALLQPPDSITEEEGWIWAPLDGLGMDHL